MSTAKLGKSLSKESILLRLGINCHILPYVLVHWQNRLEVIVCLSILHDGYAKLKAYPVRRIWKLYSLKKASYIVLQPSRIRLGTPIQKAWLASMELCCRKFSLDS